MNHSETNSVKYDNKVSSLSSVCLTTSADIDEIVDEIKNNMEKYVELLQTIVNDYRSSGIFHQFDEIKSIQSKFNSNKDYDVEQAMNDIYHYYGILFSNVLTKFRHNLTCRCAFIRHDKFKCTELERKLTELKEQYENEFDKNAQNGKPFQFIDVIGFDTLKKHIDEYSK